MKGWGQVLECSYVPFVPYKSTDNSCKKRRNNLFFNPIIKEIKKSLTFPVPLNILSLIDSFPNLFCEQTVNENMIDIL